MWYLIRSVLQYNNFMNSETWLIRATDAVNYLLNEVLKVGFFLHLTLSAVSLDTTANTTFIRCLHLAVTL